MLNCMLKALHAVEHAVHVQLHSALFRNRHSPIVLAVLVVAQTAFLLVDDDSREGANLLFAEAPDSQC